MVKYVMWLQSLLKPVMLNIEKGCTQRLLTAKWISILRLFYIEFPWAELACLGRLASTGKVSNTSARTRSLKNQIVFTPAQPTYITRNITLGINFILPGKNIHTRKTYSSSEHSKFHFRFRKVSPFVVLERWAPFFQVLINAFPDRN
jgi:hypothetical protein